MGDVDLWHFALGASGQRTAGLMLRAGPAVWYVYDVLDTFGQRKGNGSGFVFFNFGACSLRKNIE